MRFRLVHSLALLLLGAVAAAVVAMGVMMAINLRNGFQGYLVERDLEQLGKLAHIVEARLARDNGVEMLRQQQLTMHDFLDSLAVEQGLPIGRPRDDGDRPGRPDGPRGQRPPPGPPDGGFGGRVGLYDLTHLLLIGRDLPIGADAVVELPINVAGTQVAWLCMLKARPVPDAVEQKFLRNQYRGILVVAAGLILLVLGSAWWFAKRWTRPLLEVQAATERIAHGALDVRLTTGRRDELGDVMRNVNSMAEGLQRLERSRRRWLADMSHELRTPLTVLQGEIEALVDGVRPLSPHAMVSLRDEVLTLGRLVNDLHTLAMADLQTLPCQFEKLEVQPWLMALLQRCRERFAAQGLTLTFELQALQGLTAMWDRTRLEQLVNNLLENSSRYTDAPGQIVVTTAHHDAQVEIFVDDSAPGVPSEALPRLFEPLYRVDDARTRQTGGSGLGLAICEAIVRAHGGTIRAEAAAIGGLRVVVTLPLRNATEAA